MNKNSYVTAALFVVFVLLTVVYFNLDNGTGTEPIVALNETDPLAVSEMATPDTDDEEGEEAEQGQEAQQAPAPAQENQGGQEQQQAPAPGGTSEQQAPAPGGNELGAGSDVTDETEATEAQTTSRIAAMRHELERSHSEAVASLTSIIASPDHDATTKNDALAQMDVLTSIANSRAMVEATLAGMGFSDVLVDANPDNQTVIVTVEIPSGEEAPSIETVAEMTLLTAQQFGPRNRVSVNFTPVN